LANQKFYESFERMTTKHVRTSFNALQQQSEQHNTTKEKPKSLWNRNSTTVEINRRETVSNRLK